jgi:hypothetical protein
VRTPPGDDLDLGTSSIAQTTRIVREEVIRYIRDRLEQESKRRVLVYVKEPSR